MRHEPIPPDLFIDRRKRFAKQMDRDAIAVFYSNAPMPCSGDQDFPFRQDSDVFALSGLDQPGTIIVLYPQAKDPAWREMAFILPHDPHHAIWNGKRYTIREAQSISGIETVLPVSRWNKWLSQVIDQVSSVYLNSNIPKTSADRMANFQDQMAREWKTKWPDFHYRSTASILQRQRMIKHPVELELMRRAIAVTGEAFDNVLGIVSPGMKEYEIEAVLSHTITQHGCYHAFEPIVASGKSACTLHYTRNDGVLRPKSLMLLDFGAAYAYMASDMSRTIPISGRFTPRQREIYLEVLHILNEITSIMRPGVTIAELNVETNKLMDRALLNLKLVTRKELRQQDKTHPVRLKYFMHGIGHHLGYDVHDIHEKSAPLKTGMVLTCEPGLYIAKEKTGIRLENDILITRGKPRNLMTGIPIDPDEIEDRMNL
ncbi:MAG TPA: Xaa-Pro aminopeptidase [Saprospiraceae bacterium]|nr:Xaa-Pro aminopeptidase [Saprospiraceae bacterium]